MKSLSILIFSPLLLGLVSCDAKPIEAAVPLVRNYTSEDCIIDGMKGVTNDAAARAVASACYTKFQRQSDNVKALPPEARAKVQGEAKFFNGRITGLMTNENDAWVVTEATIEVTGKASDALNKSGVMNVPLKLELNPRSSQAFNEPLGDLQNIDQWRVTAARGWQKATSNK